MTETTQPSHIQLAGKYTKIMIRKAWKTELEGGSWPAHPFDWSALSDAQRAALSPPEGLTPFALVGPTVYETDDFDTIRKSSTTFVFAHDTEGKVFVLSDGVPPHQSAVTVDELTFKPGKR